MVFVHYSFPPPFVDVRPRLGLSECRSKNPSSDICGLGSVISDALRMLKLGSQALHLPGSSFCLGSKGVGKVCPCLSVAFPP